MSIFIENKRFIEAYEFLRKKSLIKNKSDLARKLNKHVQIVYDVFAGKLKITSEMLVILEKEFNINKSYILFGEGALINSSTNKDVVNEPFSEYKNENNNTFVSLLPLSAQAGTLNDFISGVKESECEKIISPIKGVDFAITVSGESMSPEYPSGTQVFIKKINEKAFIDWGRTYVLDTCNGIVLKRIVPGSADGYVKCLSINPDPVFAPFEVSLKDVFGIYRVLLSMSIK